MARDDLFHGHIGGIDTLARSLLVASVLLEDGDLENARDERYAGWSGDLGTAILRGDVDLAGLEGRVADRALDPRPISGRQEALENLVNRAIWKTQ